MWLVGRVVSDNNGPNLSPHPSERTKETCEVKALKKENLYDIMTLMSFSVDNIIMTSYQSIIDASVYLNVSPWKSKTLKNQTFENIRYSGFVLFWCCELRQYFSIYFLFKKLNVTFVYTFPIHLSHCKAEKEYGNKVPHCLGLNMWQLTDFWWCESQTASC